MHRDVPTWVSKISARNWKTSRVRVSLKGQNIDWDLISLSVTWTISSETRLGAAPSLVAHLRYEDAVTEADKDGFYFPQTTTAELVQALEVLTQYDREQEEQEEAFEEVVEDVVCDREELEEEMFWEITFNLVRMAEFELSQTSWMVFS